MYVVKNVLVVDDDPLQVELLRHYFSERGCATVLTARDGKEAVEMLKGAAGKPDLIVCDIYMPNVDGIECLLSIKEICGVRSAVIFISGAGRAQIMAARQLAAGYGLTCLGALSKPVDYRDLDDLVFKDAMSEAV